MTDPSTARRPALLLLALATALAGVTRTGVSLAASPSSKGHQTTATTPHHAAVQRTPAHSLATTPKAKHPGALAKTQPKTPVNTRVAAKSKVATRAHRAASKPAKSMAKNPKHAA
jgi:hypothetical protein